jgi:hypothetical protein
MTSSMTPNPHREAGPRTLAAVRRARGAARATDAADTIELFRDAAQAVVDRRIGLVPGYRSPSLDDAIDALDALLAKLEAGDTDAAV